MVKCQNNFLETNDSIEKVSQWKKYFKLDLAQIGTIQLQAYDIVTYSLNIRYPPKPTLVFNQEKYSLSLTS